MSNSTAFARSDGAMTDQKLARLADLIKTWGRELGFQQVGITDTELSAHEDHLDAWLE